MYDIQMGDMTYQFLEMIWECGPVRSTQLVHLAAERLEWKKPTTYTVIRRLCEKGIIKNEDSIVTALISKERFLAEQSGRFVEENFGGSLPLFLSAFASAHQLSEEDLAYLRKLTFKEGDD